MIKAVRGVDKPARQSRSRGDQFRQIARESGKTYNPVMLSDAAHSHSTKTADARPVSEQHRGGSVQLLWTPRFSVERRTVTTEASETVTREVVVHPGAVIILPILHDGRVVMIRQRRHAVEEELWELPAGTRELAEAPIDAARRELEEEAGYRTECITPMVEFFTAPGISTERMHAFVATNLRPVSQRLERGELIETEVLTLNEVRTKLTAGDIHDGKTMAVLGLYFMRINEKQTA